MGRRKRKSGNLPDSVTTPQQQQQQQQQQKNSESNCYEGERLVGLLKSLDREIETAKRSNNGVLPEKIWIKQQFAIGINDVTRTLERMKPSAGEKSSANESVLDYGNREDSFVCLQAVLLAGDCNPRGLTKHILSLAPSRGVPLIFVRDKKAGSLRLGELVKLKTAIAIGVKVKGSGINRLIEEILHERGSGLGKTVRDDSNH
ncbi:hypothetical protein Syun_028588 [Stephania yunnanensis]|uniref:Ribosomal protein eL8/eL30/eS12/Gadd45 domain-containing protein n=1 Tax=Stephania yunnanensis TaxID=152371 RepID=A0AAP0E426_9MAGN